MDIRDLPLAQSGEMHTGALDITVIEQNETGKVLCESANRINLRFSAKEYPAVLKSGITFRESLQSQEGGDHPARAGSQQGSHRQPDYSVVPGKVANLYSQKPPQSQTRPAPHVNAPASGQVCYVVMLLDA